MRWADFAPFGSSRERTAEGFLLCRDCVLARTGIQHYGPGETPLAGDFVSIERTEDEVFHPDAIASCCNKPVCNDHPVDWQGGRMDITPQNWRQLAVGTVLNPHRSPTEGDVLVADLMIYDQDAIDAILAGKTQLSCGYDAEYEAMGPGRGRQRNIRINHVALVDQGRCGVRCSIGDAAMRLGRPAKAGGRRIIVHGPLKPALDYLASRRW